MLSYPKEKIKQWRAFTNKVVGGRGERNIQMEKKKNRLLSPLIPDNTKKKKHFFFGKMSFLLISAASKGENTTKDRLFFSLFSST